MKKTLLRVNALYLLIMGSIAILIPSALGLFLVVASGFDSLSAFLSGIGVAIVCGVNLSLIISGIMSLLYLKGKKTYYAGIVFDYIGLLSYITFIIIFINLDALNFFTDYYSGFVNVGAKIGIVITLFALFMFPLIWNRIILYKDKKNLTSKQVLHHYRIPAIIIIVIVVIATSTGLIKTIIVGTNKIKVTDKNTYTYADFEKELKERDPNPKTNYYEISARDSRSKYGYKFSNVSSSGYYISKSSDRKFPFLMSENFVAGISWYLYYVNGEIYAIPSDMNYLYSSSYYSTNKDNYKIVVSEQEEITIYNAEKNYYIKGGGITDVRSGMQRTCFPTTQDVYDSSCYRIIVVDRVDSDTLQKIAKDL